MIGSSTPHDLIQHCTLDKEHAKAGYRLGYELEVAVKPQNRQPLNSLSQDEICRSYGLISLGCGTWLLKNHKRPNTSNTYTVHNIHSMFAFRQTGSSECPGTSS